MTSPSETVDGPLSGRTVLVTRSEAAGESFAEQLRRRGASAIVAPAIDLVPAEDAVLDEAIDGLSSGRFAWVLFTSRSGVEAVAGRLAERGMNGVSLLASVAAVGDGTAHALRQAGIRADLVPERFTTSALGEAMPQGTGQVLLARADIATEDLEGAVAKRGWTPVRVNAYRTIFRDEMPSAALTALREGHVDAITFTSASTVRGFTSMAGSALSVGDPAPRIVCIGPVTADAARGSGLRVDAVADPHTIDGLLAALEALFTEAKE